MNTVSHGDAGRVVNCVAVKAVRLTPLVRAATLLLAIGLSGCSLFSVNLKGPQQSDCHLAQSDDKRSVKNERALSNCTVDGALRYAADWRKEYLRAAGQHSIARNANALVGIPASAVAVFYGISGHGSPDRISRLSLGAAGYYSATSFLAPPGKQRAYLEGALALSCAIDAGLDYRFADARVTALGTAIDAAVKAEMALNAAVTADSGLLPADAPVLARAAVVAADAANLISHAYEIHNAHSRAALRLATVVDRIVVETAQLVSSQETGLQSLLAMAGSLRQTAMGFGLSSLPASTPAPGGIKAQSNPGGRALTQAEQDAEAAREAAVKRIEAAITTLRSALTALTISVRGMSIPASSGDAYDLCRPVTTFTGFKVEPAETARTVEVGKTITFTITNSQSNAFPTSSVSGKNAASVKVSAPKVVDGKLVIEVLGEKATGADPALLAISDPTGALILRYTIAVLPATPATPAATEPGKPDPAATKPTPKSNFAADFSRDEIKRLQCHLGLTGPQSDGDLGNTTYAALAIFASKHGLAMGDQLSQALFDAVLTKGTDHCAGGSP